VGAVSVTILTATLPERADMLAEAVASVKAQQLATFDDVDHVVLIDHKREGAGALLDDGLQLVKTPWVMVLDDDDVLYPNHLATVMARRRDYTDVIYTMPKVVGGTFTQYHEPFDSGVLARRNIVSHTALMRTSYVRQAGGWNNVRTFDWDLFKRIDALGADFLQLPDVTWEYRLHGSNWSHGTLEGAMA
jgi:glycosyltransferase involved in cell wall biosynthesis